MQQKEKENDIKHIGDFSYKSQYLNLEKIYDFKECVELIAHAVQVIQAEEPTLFRMYRWLEREERRLQRDEAKRKKLEQ